MSRAALQLRRDTEGGWAPVGVWLGTVKALQSRFIPGILDGWVRMVYEDARLPVMQDGSIGTWEDWIWFALGALNNEHDLTIREVTPELTVDITYAKYVLGLTEKQRQAYRPRTIANLITVPVDDLTYPEGRA